MSDGRINRHNIARLAVEGVVVVASILIAFALDAWWADKQLEQEIIEDLAIVDYELAENVRLVKLSLEQMIRVVDASHSLIADLKAQAESEDVEVADTLVFGVSSSARRLTHRSAGLTPGLLPDDWQILTVLCCGSVWPVCVEKSRTSSKSNGLPVTFPCAKSTHSFRTRSVTSILYYSYLLQDYIQDRASPFTQLVVQERF